MSIGPWDPFDVDVPQCADCGEVLPTQPNVLTAHLVKCPLCEQLVCTDCRDAHLEGCAKDFDPIEVDSILDGR